MVLFQPLKSRAGPKHQGALKVFIPKHLKLDCLPGRSFLHALPSYCSFWIEMLATLHQMHARLLLSQPVAATTASCQDAPYHHCHHQPTPRHHCPRQPAPRQPALNSQPQLRLSDTTETVFLSSIKVPRRLFRAHRTWKAHGIISPGPFPATGPCCPPLGFPASLLTPAGSKTFYRASLL